MADNDHDYSEEDFQLWLSCFSAAFAAINLNVTSQSDRAEIAALCAQLADGELTETQLRRPNPDLGEPHSHSVNTLDRCSPNRCGCCGDRRERAHATGAGLGGYRMIDATREVPEQLSSQTLKVLCALLGASATAH